MIKRPDTSELRKIIKEQKRYLSAVKLDGKFHVALDWHASAITGSLFRDILKLFQIKQKEELKRESPTS